MHMLSDLLTCWKTLTAFLRPLVPGFWPSKGFVDLVTDVSAMFTEGAAPCPLCARVPVPPRPGWLCRSHRQHLRQPDTISCFRPKAWPRLIQPLISTIHKTSYHDYPIYYQYNQFHFNVDNQCCPKEARYLLNGSKLPVHFAPVSEQSLADDAPENIQGYSGQIGYFLK